ncbi:hypothetical protein BS78_05G102700 [Paspalum vaginatum]|nr:hypothetical protein BS78_05G102700 [Paspalum vaginatum]
MDAASSFWSDLPLDLLRDISRRLHDATDYVRFHTVCKSWRGTLPPARCRPPFLPWLLAPPSRDATGGRHGRMARCVLASEPSRRHTRMEDRRWVLSADDGMAARLLLPACGDSDGGLAGCPLTGSAAAAAPLPCYSDEMRPWVERAVGRVSVDGTILLYAWVSSLHGPDHPPRTTFEMAVLRAGDDMAWMLQQHTVDEGSGDYGHWCVAHHAGKIALCRRNRLRIWSAQAGADLGEWSSSTVSGEESRRVFTESSYLVESRGELLWVFVHDGFVYYEDLSVKTLPAVTVFALKEHKGEDGELGWVRRDGRSFADRVMFLGKPTSFAVDAARFGVTTGCAYFVHHGRQRLLFKYSFCDSSVEVVEQLPDDFDSKATTWITPQPVIWQGMSMLPTYLAIYARSVQLL